MYQLILALALALTPHAAHAITILPPCTASGDCGITDILAVAVNFAEFLLGISGAVALAMFVWGGFQYILAGIQAGDINKAKATIKNAVIGIVIIFLSGIIVRFADQALTGGKSIIHAVGESCSSNGIYVEIPAGYTNVGDPNSLVADKVECIAKDNCASLNSALQTHGRPEAGGYKCYATDSPNVSSCVRGLCPSAGSGFACCLCTGGDCSPGATSN
jgi:hypothetical protein